MITNKQYNNNNNNKQYNNNNHNNKYNNNNHKYKNNLIIIRILRYTQTQKRILQEIYVKNLKNKTR